MSTIPAAPPLSASERARGRRLAIASNVPGMTFLTAFTNQLPTLALVSLGASETMVGVQSGMVLGFQALQLPALRFVSWFTKRSILVTGQLFALAASLPLVFFTAVSALEPETARVVVLVSVALTAIGLNFADLVWFALLRAYLDPGRIGRFFGVIRSSWHIAVIVFFTGGQYWLAGHEGAFGALFGVAWLAGILRVALIWRMPERSERTGDRIRARDALALVRRDPRLRRYLIGVCWGAGVRVSVLPFTLVMLRRALGFANSDIVLTTIAQFSGGLVSLYLWGALIDRVGPYAVFRFTSLATAGLYVGLAQLDSSGPSTLLAAVVFFFLHAVLGAGYGLSDTRVLFELAPPEAPARMLVVGGSLTGLALGLSPMLVGALLDPLLSHAADPLTV